MRKQLTGSDYEERERDRGKETGGRYGGREIQGWGRDRGWETEGEHRRGDNRLSCSTRQHLCVLIFYFSAFPFYMSCPACPVLTVLSACPAVFRIRIVFLRIRILPKN
jgi:hypothetical protein